MLALALLAVYLRDGLAAAALPGYFALDTLALALRLRYGFLADSIRGLYGGDTLIEEGERIRSPGLYSGKPKIERRISLIPSRARA